MADAVLIAAAGGYRFSGSERRAFNQFDSDTKWAYLEFARAEHRREDARIAQARADGRRTPRRYPRYSHEIMQAWKALTPHERRRRVDAARRDEHRPDAMDIEVEVPNRRIPGSPGSVNEFDNPDEDGFDEPGWGNFNYEFVQTIFRRGWRREREYSVTVRLYIGRDNNGIIRDRIVIKTADYLDSDTNENIHRDAMWFETRMLRINRHLENVPPHRHILIPRSYRRSDLNIRILDRNGNPEVVNGVPRRMRRRGVREYIDYCELGDLHEFMQPYYGNNLPAGADPKKIPEKIIWLVLKGVLGALYCMTYGKGWTEADGSDGGDSPKANDDDPGAWRPFPFVHRDIKPMNIFLRKTEWADFDVVLADFDLLEELEDARDENCGSAGYIAPEHENRNLVLDVRADMWSLAAVAWDMMNAHRGTTGPEGILELKYRLQAITRDPELNDPDYRDRIDDLYPLHQYINEYILPRNDLPRYTTWLTDLVNRCARFDPLQRPSIGRALVEATQGESNMDLFGEREEERIELRQDTFVIGRRATVRRRVEGAVVEEEQEGQVGT